MNNHKKVNLSANLIFDKIGNYFTNFGKKFISRFSPSNNSNSMATKHSIHQSPIYIDEDIMVFTGEKARKRLDLNNDVGFLTENEGITQVDIERWKIAQNFEKKTWMEKALSARDDRNINHYESFEQYRALRRLSFDSAIELGCGPFTNLRLIAKKCNIKKCTLLDPLIEDYLQHPNCPYTAETLFLRSGFLQKPKPLTIQRIISLPIEQMPTNYKFDLVVIINVIEHCFDIQEIFNKIKLITNPKGYLVFHDKYYSHSEVALSVKNQYDAGHPLRVDGRLIDDFLEQNYLTKFRKETKQSYFLEGEKNSYQGLYFIGQSR